MITTIAHRRALRLACAGALMLLAQFAPQLAHAQYSWIDAKGTRVFSDRPPPPGTPAGRILKTPHRPDAGADNASAPPAPASAAASAPASAAASAPASGPMPAGAPGQPSLAEREADYRKRQAQHQEDEKKAQAEATRKADQQQMCADARQEEAQLASGMRINQTGAGGERSYMAEEERARRLARAREALAQCR